uniref:Mediator of RNA polymerase II transcription subunit 23 n=1 Tax=Brugia timori TaxID=42155 RepID=A0A158PT19_9BILA
LLSNKDDPRYIHYERILSSIFMIACNEGVLPLSDCCELLILCTNFSLTTPMDSRKFEYMQKNLHLIDYKGLRNILKLLVVERMQEMLLTLIDRQLNLLPCIFTITELHRVSNNSRAFLLPRVAKKFNDMFISFRPLTEMVTIIGRSWLYPIAAHISFPVSTPSWKLEVTTTRLHQRAHLPYKSELFAPQSFLLYTLLRQPRGKDTISVKKRSCMLFVLFPSVILFIYFIQLSETVYRKGRDELMWVILQYVAVYIDRVSNEEMVRVTWSGADTDPLLFVRFLVPAILPKPSESLWRQIQFLQERTADSDPNIQNVADHNAVLAAVANALKFHYKLHIYVFTEWFFFKQFPELSYREMEAKMRREMQIELGMRPIEQSTVNPELHMPIYYGNIMERILPVRNNQICFTPPQKFRYYRRKFGYDNLSDFEKFLRDGKYALLTPSFISDNHQLSLPSQFCQALVDRILQASNYAHQPPAFVYKDWRFAEMPPAGQALTGACIELLASPHAPVITAHALIDLVFIRPLHQPFVFLIMFALILTALPVSFQQVFYDHIVSVLDSEALHGDPSVCFGSLESECLLLTENQLLTNLALGHAYLQHCNTVRIHVYKMTVKVNERVGLLKYEDSICDFLYHMKYMYVGDFVKNEAEQAIQRLSPSMRNKLKYISHTQMNTSSWYWGNMSWKDAEKVLMSQLPGTYLVRDSASDRYIFTISYRTKHSVHHTRLAQHGGNFCLGGNLIL